MKGLKILKLLKIRIWLSQDQLVSRKTLTLKMRNRERLVNQTNKNSHCLQEAHSGKKKRKQNQTKTKTYKYSTHPVKFPFSITGVYYVF